MFSSVKENSKLSVLQLALNALKSYRKTLKLRSILFLLLTSCIDDCTPLIQESDALQSELAQRDSVLLSIWNTFSLVDSNLISLKGIETELIVQMRAIMALNQAYVNDLQGSLLSPSDINEDFDPIALRAYDMRKLEQISLV